MLSIDLPERAYCADVDFPMAVVGTAGRGIIIYQLDGQPKEFKKVSPLIRIRFGNTFVYE
jgi:mRNA export factor